MKEEAGQRKAGDLRDMDGATRERKPAGPRDTGLTLKLL